MADIAVAPIVLKDVLMKIGGTDNYSAHCSSVTFTPASSSVTWQGLTPSALFTDNTEQTWTVTIEYAQDWSATGLSTYLFSNAGTSKALVFQTKKTAATGDPIFTTAAVLQSGPIGGAVNTVSTASVTMGCDKPVLTRAP